MKGTTRLLFIAMGLVSAMEAGCAADDSDISSNAGDLEDYYSDSHYYENENEETSETDNREHYEDVGTNPFVITEHDPFSTFAADVDTASYDIFRRDIDNGNLPDSTAVRLEEFVNYFDYEYPAPSSSDAHPFTINLAAAPNFINPDTTLLRVGIQAEAAPAKKPANLVFLVDVSGSMTGPEKLPLVKRVLSQTVEMLDSDDTISIVTYASGTEVRLSPTPVSDDEKILDVVDMLTSGGSTAGAGGIQLAYEQAERAFIEGGINHVLLCTDGDFNVGPSSDTELVNLIERKRETGVTLTVLGFGYGNLNDSMMEKISNAGNGIYAVIASESQANKYVEQRMLSSIYHVAKDMKIQVEFNPEQVRAYRLLGYENRAIADNEFRDDTVDGGEVGAGHRVTALYELVMTGDEIPDPVEAPAVDDGKPVAGDREVSGKKMVLVKVRYKEPGATAADEAFEVTSTMTPSDIAESADRLDEDYRWAAAVAAFAEILKKSPFVDKGDLDTIEAVISKKTWLDSDRSEFRSLFNIARDML